MKILMFSFGELLLTSVVAVVVLGPKRLPQAAYQLGRLMRKANTIVQPVKDAITACTKAAELEQNQQRAAAAELRSQNDNKV